MTLQEWADAYKWRGNESWSDDFAFTAAYHPERISDALATAWDNVDSYNWPFLIEPPLKGVKE